MHVDGPNEPLQRWPTVRRDRDPCTIQEACFKYVADEFQPDADMEAKIRLCAFENGIDRDQVVRVLAVELRDQLLEGYLPEET